MCGHCNQQYQKLGKYDHEANCLDLIKFKNLELSAKLEESVAEVANVRSDLESTKRKYLKVLKEAQLQAKEAELAKAEERPRFYN